MCTVLLTTVVDRAGFITTSSGCFFFSLLDGEADAGMLFIDVVENHILFVLFTTPVYLSLL